MLQSMKLSFVLFFKFIVIIKGNENSPSIVIVGAGAAGIAAASKLFENGFKKVTILEAEGRIGGRIHSTLFQNQMIDLGGQWVHGENDNFVFKKAWPLGLLEKGNFLDGQFELFDSTGNQMNPAMAHDLKRFYFQAVDNLDKYAETNSGSTGQFFQNEFEKYFKARPYLKNDSNGLMDLFDRIQMEEDGGDTWWDVSTRNAFEYHMNSGSNQNNWKERTFSTIFDILMKRFPNPEQELPIMKNTMLNAEVTLIFNDERTKKVTVTTNNGGFYVADHVIVTVSLGVLKDKYLKLFYPPLSSEKVKAIKELGFGSETKIFLSFDKEWWNNKDPGFYFYWSDTDKAEMEKDPEKKWLLGLNRFGAVDHRYGLLYGWVSGKYSREMEQVSEEKIFNQLIEVLHRFIGKYYDVTRPRAMLRSQWNNNSHFKGAYTFLKVSTPDNVSPETLAKFIGKGKPTILFAGEATHPSSFSTVHGAIETGFREADRLIKLYPHLKKNQNKKDK